MSPATATRRAPKTLSADPTERQFDEDGYEVRYEEIDGVETPLSLKPYPEAERPHYWCQHNGIEMRFKSRYLTDDGRQPTIQRERWTDGDYYARNEWEDFKVRQWMKQTLLGCVDPDTFRHVLHPKGEGHMWRCQCGYACPNLDVFEQHQREYGHQIMRVE